MADLKLIVRTPLVLVSYWFQVRRSVPSERWAHFAVMARLYWRWALHGIKGPVTVPLLGHTFTGWHPGIMRTLFREIFLEHQYAFTSSTEKPLIIDCGANIGMSVLYFKRRWPGARILAIEANPRAFELLKRNVEQNGLKDVECLNVAVADAEGTLDFFVNHQAGTLLGSLREDRGGTERLQVAARRLSDLLAALPGEVAAVKIDIEGAEWQVLKDLQELGALARPRQYLIEYHHRIGDERSRLSVFLKALEDAGYEYTITAAPGRQGSMQDVLLHCTR